MRTLICLLLTLGAMAAEIDFTTAALDVPTETVEIDGRQAVRFLATEEEPIVLEYPLAGDDWPAGPFALGILVDCYDRVSKFDPHYRGDQLAFEVVDAEGKRLHRHSLAYLYLAGRDGAAEPHRQARWRVNSDLIRDVSAPATLRLTLDRPVVLRSLAYFPVDTDVVAAWDAHTAKCREFFARETELNAMRALLDDTWRQQRRQQLYAGSEVNAWTPPFLASLIELETLLDRHYYAGRAAVLRGEPVPGRDEIQRRQERLGSALLMRSLDVDGADPLGEVVPVTVPPHPRAAAVPKYFRERLRFLAFSNSGITLLDDAERALFHQTLSTYGVECLFYVHGGQATAPGAGDDAWQYVVDTANKRAAENARYGWKTIFATGEFHVIGKPFLYIPEWFRQRHAGECYLARNAEGNEDPNILNIWHPGARTYLGDFAEAMGRITAANPDVVACNWFDEAKHRWPSLTPLGYSDAAKEAFRAGLAKQFGEIAALNRDWGTDYADFAAIEPPPPRAEQPWNLTALAHAWYTFQRESVRAHAVMIRDRYKAVCPDKPLWYEPADGRIANVADIAHTHIRPMPVAQIGNYNNLRLHGRTVVDAETGGGTYPEGENRDIPAEQVRAVVERNLLNGAFWDCRGWTFWYRYFTSNANGYYAAFHNDPGGAAVIASRDLSSLAPLRAKLDRFNDLLLNTTIVPSGAAYVRGDLGEQGALPIGDAWLMVNGTYADGYPMLLLNSGNIVDGTEDLSRFTALYVCHSPAVEPGLSEKMIAWVKAGGVMIAAGPWGLFDPRGRPDGALLREAFGDVTMDFSTDPERTEARVSQKITPGDRQRVGMTHEGTGPGWYFPWQLTEPKSGVEVALANAGGEPLVIEAPLGNGRVIMANMICYGLRDYWVRRLAEFAPCQAWRDDGGTLYAVVREDTAGGRYLCLINPAIDEPLQTTIHCRGGWPQVVDLGIATPADDLAGVAVPATVADGVTSFPMLLAPGEGTILALRAAE